MFGLNQFAAEVHQNAVEHGFWDDDTTDERQIALIHSEWSEALQADRSGCTPREVCMEMIDQSDGMVLLPGWEQSKGARVERAYAEYNEKPAWLLEELIGGGGT